jgi:hypothetical protein
MDSVSSSSHLNPSSPTPYLLLLIIRPSDHHEGEESVFFPEVEKVTGQRGIMDQNISQHHAFEAGIEAWSQYTTECLNIDQSKFEVAHFTKLIDDFAPILVDHLGEEIKTLLALDKYDSVGVREAWGIFDKAMRKRADTVSSHPSNVLI